jgi:hypothetical protein
MKRDIMASLSIPWVFVGPAGSGKLQKARALIEEAYKCPLTFETRVFTVADDYTVYVTASPHHFEIDIPNLSMQDKQIMGELLTTFFNAGDVLNSMKLGGRKLVILRRAHALSLPAAIRVRAILQQYVLPANGTGMVWMTAREMSGSLSILEDAFVRVRIPRITLSTWVATVDPIFQTKEAYEHLEGRLERVKKMKEYGCTSFPRRVSDYYDELVEAIIKGANTKKEGSISIVLWIRARVYDVLAFCQNSPDIIDSVAAALVRNQLLLEPDQFWNGMQVLAASEPHTSYRTPLALESAFLELFEALRISRKTSSIIRNVESMEKEMSTPSRTLTIHPAITPLTSKRDGRSKGSKS